MDYVNNVEIELMIDEIDLKSDGVSCARDEFVDELTVVFVVEVGDMMVTVLQSLYDRK